MKKLSISLLFVATLVASFPSLSYATVLVEPSPKFPIALDVVNTLHVPVFLFLVLAVLIASVALLKRKHFVGALPFIFFAFSAVLFARDKRLEERYAFTSIILALLSSAVSMFYYRREFSRKSVALFALSWLLFLAIIFARIVLRAW